MCKQRRAGYAMSRVIWSRITTATMKMINLPRLKKRKIRRRLGLLSSIILNKHEYIIMNLGFIIISLDSSESAGSSR